MATLMRARPTAPQSLEALIPRARAGSRSAGRELETRLLGQLTRVAAAIVGDAKVAERIAHQALAEAIVAPGSSFVASALTRVQQLSAEADVVGQPEIDALSTVGRLVLVLCDMDGYSREKTASLLGLSVEEVTAQHHLAREQLGLSDAASTCRGWNLVARVDDLTPPEVTAASGHLEMCRPCREALAAQQASRRRLLALLPKRTLIIAAAGGVLALLEIGGLSGGIVAGGIVAGGIVAGGITGLLPLPGFHETPGRHIAGPIAGGSAPRPSGTPSTAPTGGPSALPTVEPIPGAVPTGAVPTDGVTGAVPTGAVPPGPPTRPTGPTQAPPPAPTPGPGVVVPPPGPATIYTSTVSSDAGPADLYPGGLGSVRFRLDNRNGSDVVFTRLVGGTVTLDLAHATGCDPANITVTDPGGLRLLVPAGTTAANAIPFAVAGVRMRPEAPDGCQGATFTISLTLSGSSV